MFRRIAFLLILSSVAAVEAFGQLPSPRTTNSVYGFSMVPPSKSEPVNSVGAIIGFEGDEKRYGPGARSLLSSVKRVSMPMDDVSAHMRFPATVRMFHNTLVAAM